MRTGILFLAAFGIFQHQQQLALAFTISRMVHRSGKLLTRVKRKAAEARPLQRIVSVTQDKLCQGCVDRELLEQTHHSVEALTDVIMRLPEDDRTTLLETVAQRINCAGQTKHPLVLPTSSAKSPTTSFTSSSFITSPGLFQRIKFRNRGDSKRLLSEKNRRRILSRMEKAKQTLSRSDAKLAEIETLLHATTFFLANGNGTKMESYQFPLQETRETSRLRQMDRSELKLQLLRYTEQKAQCERSRAKCRSTRYAASLELAQQ